MLRTVAPCALLLGVAATSQAQIVKKNGGYLIFIKYSKGQVVKQNVSMVAPSTGKSSSAQIVSKCLGIDKSGIISLQVTSPAGPGKPVSTRTMKIDRHGKPIGNRIEGFNGNFMWPDKPVKVGQTWSGDLNVGSTKQGDHMKALYRLTGFKTINGKQVAEIGASMDVSGQFDVAGTGVMYVRVSDGQLESATFHMGLKQFNDAGDPTTLRLTMDIKAAK